MQAEVRYPFLASAKILMGGYRSHWRKGRCYPNLRFILGESLIRHRVNVDRFRNGPILAVEEKLSRGVCSCNAYVCRKRMFSPVLYLVASSYRVACTGTSDYKKNPMKSRLCVTLSGKELHVRKTRRKIWITYGYLNGWNFKSTLGRIDLVALCPVPVWSTVLWFILLA